MAVSYTTPTDAFSYRAMQTDSAEQRESDWGPVHLIDSDTSERFQQSLEEKVVDEFPNDYFDDFEEDLTDPECVQRIYDFTLRQIRGMVAYNDEEDVVQEVFYRLHKWPIGKKYNSARHYFSLLKITIRQAIAAYWKRQHSQRRDVRKRVFVSELQSDGDQVFGFHANDETIWKRLHLKDLVQRILKKADSLSDQHKTMFQMRFLEEKSHEEICNCLGVSLRTSYRMETNLRKVLQAFVHTIEHS